MPAINSPADLAGNTRRWLYTGRLVINGTLFVAHLIWEESFESRLVDPSFRVLQFIFDQCFESLFWRMGQHWFKGLLTCDVAFIMTHAIFLLVCWANWLIKISSLWICNSDTRQRMLRWIKQVHFLISWASQVKTLENIIISVSCPLLLVSAIFMDWTHSVRVVNAFHSR